MKKSVSALLACLLAVSLIGCGGKKPQEKQQQTVSATAKTTAGLGMSTLLFNGRYAEFQEAINKQFGENLLGDFSSTAKLDKEKHSSLACYDDRHCVIVKTADDNETVVEVSTMAKGDGTPRSGADVLSFMVAVASSAIHDVTDHREVGKKIISLLKNASKTTQKTTLHGCEISLFISKETGALMTISKK